MATRKRKDADPSHDETIASTAPSAPRPRLHKLRVSNFRCIGPEPVEIELDDIVVLVGPNNAGKSSILKAYRTVMDHGSSDGSLTLEDFPNNEIQSDRLPTIELETVVFERNSPGERWVRVADTGEMFVRERWTWEAPGNPKKVGWDVAAQDWHPSEGPWGAPNIAQANRPKPHSISAFDDPAKQANAVAGLLQDALNARVKDAKQRSGSNGSNGESPYGVLLNEIARLQKDIAADAEHAIANVRQDLTTMIADVFPGYSVTFDARAEDDLEKCLSLFKAGAVLKMGPLNGLQTTMDRQGSGACRTLIWAALRILATQKSQPKGASGDRPNVLLMDEPELCLHPDAIREARRALYDLPQKGSWQVMITTHSPVFIDLARDNTSIARVSRSQNGAVHGTTIYRPKRAKLDPEDQVELKMLNICDPHVAEFFFGGSTIVVEGDTEFTAFKYVMETAPAAYKNIHVVRARGKACITSLCKILNQFGTPYSVLHDSDRATVVTKDGKTRKNPAWEENRKIFEVTRDGRTTKRVRLLASVPNFESAYLENVGKKGDKPYRALSDLRTHDKSFARVTALLDALIDHAKEAPDGAVEWDSLEALESAVARFDTDSAAGATG